ncbi:MAG: CDP-alcohol phosphatidyltransferase family protein [Candidatus Omnitrophota bacterium]
MVESLAELKKLCQKPDYKTKGNWYVRTILRDAALPATRILLHTSVTANQVTLISLAVSAIAMVFLAIPGTGAFFAGAVLLQLWYYLDHVDGQIARYRKTDCLTGRFLDFMTHHLVHPALFFALGFYAFHITGSVAFILWGFISVLAILAFNLIHDVKYKTFFEAVSKRKPAAFELKGIECSQGIPEREVSLRRRLFSFAHKLCEIHVMMNLLTLAVFIQMLFSSWDLRFFLFILYGVLAPAVAVLKLAYILKNRQIDREYDDTFHATT